MTWYFNFRILFLTSCYVNIGQIVKGYGLIYTKLLLNYN
jgi:hypothetical protein